MGLVAMIMHRNGYGQTVFHGRQSRALLENLKNA